MFFHLFSEENHDGLNLKQTDSDNSRDVTFEILEPHSTAGPIKDEIDENMEDGDEPLPKLMKLELVCNESEIIPEKNEMMTADDEFVDEVKHY